jgi:hypothetical protein
VTRLCVVCGTGEATILDPRGDRLLCSDCLQAERLALIYGVKVGTEREQARFLMRLAARQHEGFAPTD